MMNRTHKFLNAGRFCCVSLVLLLFAGLSVMAQDEARTQEAPVRVSLKLDKETIMLGEPMFIAFEVTNLSGETLCLGVGGDYRNKFGRPESFDVQLLAPTARRCINPKRSLREVLSVVRQFNQERRIPSDFSFLIGPPLNARVPIT
jgi:hypothetical protein